MLTIKEAKEQGYIVDTNCYPHLAYKGERFNPSEKQHVMTEIESYWREYALKMETQRDLVIEALKLAIPAMCAETNPNRINVPLERAITKAQQVILLLNAKND